MELDLTAFRPAERSTLRLRVLYEQAGYRKYRMARFEEYALYQQYESFLPDAQVVTFTDLDGKLRAIKPDVTLSIAKNAQPAPGTCKKYYYTEQVCRPSRESHTFTEISQMGLECLGAVGSAARISPSAREGPLPSKRACRVRVNCSPPSSERKTPSGALHWLPAASSTRSGCSGCARMPRTCEAPSPGGRAPWSMRQVRPPSSERYAPPTSVAR